jgi:phospho-N-acetylmuramoyl-pentapeptide-transferase
MSTLAITILLPTLTAFVIGVCLTPVVTHYLYKHQVWKKSAGKGVGYGGGKTPIFDELHKIKDTNTPRMGGIVIWGSVLITTGLFAIFGNLLENPALQTLNFLSREQTWLPLLALVSGAIVGFIDDYLIVKGTGNHFAGGLPLSQRLLVVTGTATFIGWWFYSKLGVSTVSFFDIGTIELGILFIPFFIFVATCVYMSSVIDGIDGLSGGVFMSVFAGYSGVALLQGQFDIAALCAVLVGAILAFLWFNIPPARFYMTETGIMALTMTLTVIAFMTDTLADGIGVSVLPIIGFLLLITVVANTIQILSKKLTGKKVFLVAPLHHHFEALGWAPEKVTMRYWIIGILCALIGVMITAAL